MTNYTVEDVLDMDNYSINQLDEYFKKNKCEVHIMFISPAYNKTWHVIVKKKDDGIAVEINTTHTSLYSALYDAYEKFNQVAKRGAPNLLAPVIEHKPSKDVIHHIDGNPYNNNPSNLRRMNADDDIPF